MGTPPVVFNISSDDESGPDEIVGVEDFGWNEPKADDDDDWLLKLLEVADDQADDSDEVVLVAEFKPTKKIPKSKSANSTIKVVDDDCVILDSDPDGSMATVNDSADGSDELLIVAEKGQIACRDYPHPRHLCAIFSFTSTPHEKHCDLCHCYVCDTIAPCPYWGVGISLADHCHATDKVEKWKMQRKSFRKENHNSVSAASAQANQNLPHDASRLPLNSALDSCLSRFNTTDDSLPKYQIFQPTTLQPISSDNLFASKIINIEVHQQSAFPESRIQQPVSHRHLGVHNSSSQVIRKSIRRDRGNPLSCLTSRFVTSDLMFKRTAALGATQATQANQFPSHRVINPTSVAPLQPAGDSNGWKDCPASVISKTYSDSVAGMVCPSQVEINSLPIHQLNGNQIAHQYLDQRENSSYFSSQSVNPIQSVDQNIYRQEHFSQSADHNSFKPGIPVQDGAGAAPNLNFDWLTDDSLNSQPTPAESSQLLVSDSMHRHWPLNEPDANITGNFNSSINVGPGNNCLMENQSLPEDPNWLYQLNILSPPPTSDEAGMLGFYFETS